MQINWSKKTTLTHCTDEALMQKIVKGNVQAFEALYDRYSALMYRFFYRMLRQNEALSEDFTQDIFLKIIEKPTLFDSNRSFKSWIYSVAANKCKNAYRDRKDVQNIDNQAFEYEENIAFNLDNQAFEAHLMTAIDGLEMSVKQCFVLRYLEDLNIKDIALIVGIPEGTVKSRLHHTTKKLAAELAWCRDIL
jgi:RNA polymerase sigma-70 factor, ECF subfamily